MHSTSGQNEQVGPRIGTATFVGRTRELVELEAIARSVEGERRGALVAVRGDAGVGKSRVVAELGRRQQDAGWLVAVGGCVDLGATGLAHAPLTEILRRLDEELGHERLAEVAGDGFDEVARFLPGGAGRAEVDPGRLIEQVLNLLVRLGDDRPALIVFEDLHWADASTRELLSFLARNLDGSRVLVVGTYRPDDVHRRHPLAPVLAELGRSGMVTVTLDGLDRRAVAELASEVTGQAPDAARLAQLVDRTDGNPFYLEQLLDGQSSPYAVPSGLRELVLARLDALDDDTVEVLRPASVLGREVRDDLLVAVTGWPAERIEQALSDAVSHHVLEVEHGTCRFHHDLVREAIYDSLLPGQRHRLHVAAADAIAGEAVRLDPPGMRWALLAHHWRHTDHPVEALQASIEAARWAQSIGAPSEQADHLEEALRLWPQVDAAARPGDLDEAELMSEAARARAAAGEVQRARTLAEAACRELDGSADVERLATAHQQVAMYARGLGDMAASSAEHARAAALVEPSPVSAVKALVMARVAQHLMLSDDLVPALAQADEAVALAQAAGDRRVEGHATCTRGCVLGLLGRLDEGLEALRAARAIAAEVEHRDDLSRAHQNLTYIQLFAGRAEDALADASLGLEIVRRQGTMLSSGIGITEHQGEAAVRLGRWDEALALLDAFPYDALEGYTLCSFAAPRFDVWLRRGDLDAATATLAPALERATGMDDMQFGANTRIRAAQLAAARGQIDEARRWIDEVLALAEDRVDMVYAPKATWIGLAIEAAQDEPDLAAVARLEERLDAFEPRARSLGGELLAEPAACIASGRAEVSEARGEPDPQRWADALDAWERCGDVYWVAATRHRLADARLRARGDRSRAAAELEAARVSATALGAAPLLADLDLLARRGRLADAAAEDADERLRDLGLTDREREVLGLVVEGRTNRQIGEALFISEKTASVHVTNLLRKLGVDNRRAAAEMARRLA
jgi:DNA-binding CsgD family transcriptional regulator